MSEAQDLRWQMPRPSVRGSVRKPFQNPREPAEGGHRGGASVGCAWTPGVTHRPPLPVSSAVEGGTP